jgi:hypothetical protein
MVAVQNFFLGQNGGFSLNLAGVSVCLSDSGSNLCLSDTKPGG